jgi:hypothetical protein
MIYKGCTITRTETTTDTPHGVRKVYAIEGEINKQASQRPFITTISAARYYINAILKMEENNFEDYGEMDDATACALHPSWQRVK